MRKWTYFTKPRKGRRQAKRSAMLRLAMKRVVFDQRLGMRTMAMMVMLLVMKMRRDWIHCSDRRTWSRVEDMLAILWRDRRASPSMLAGVVFIITVCTDAFFSIYNPREKLNEN